MQMLAAGGLPALTDELRPSDLNNPRGYYEWEKAKHLPQDPGCIAEAEGKAVKVISSLLMSLPAGHEYRVLFMMRPLEEVVASQAEMIVNLGTRGSSLPAETIMAALRAHRNQVLAWLKTRQDVAVLELDYHALLADPPARAAEVASFFDLPLDTEAMAKQVDPALHRQRSSRLFEASGSSRDEIDSRMKTVTESVVRKGGFEPPRS